MTNMEFQSWLSAEFAKHPMLNARWKKNTYTMNELVHVLRQSGRDFCINVDDPDSDGWGMIPSVMKTYIPTRDLVRMVKSVFYEEFEDDGQCSPLLCVAYTATK